MVDEQALVESPAVVEPEKTLTQSQVNEIVKREKANVADKLRREYESSQSGQNKSVETPPANDSMLEDKVFNRIIEHAKKLEEEENKRARDREVAEQKAALEAEAKTYLSKVALGKENISDFDEVMSDFDPTAFPELSILAGRLDNTADVMYELSKNPNKLAEIHILASRSEKLAMKALDQVSKSIAKNQEALKNVPKTNAPLSRLKSSTAGADSGEMTVKDFKNLDYLRG